MAVPCTGLDEGRRSQPKEGELGSCAAKVKGVSRDQEGGQCSGRPWRLWSERVPGRGDERRLEHRDWVSCK